MNDDNQVSNYQAVLQQLPPVGIAHVEVVNQTGEPQPIHVSIVVNDQYLSSSDPNEYHEVQDKESLKIALIKPVVEGSYDAYHQSSDKPPCDIVSLRVIIHYVRGQEKVITLDENSHQYAQTDEGILTLFPVMPEQLNITLTETGDAF